MWSHRACFIKSSHVIVPPHLKSWSWNYTGKGLRFHFLWVCARASLGSKVIFLMFNIELRPHILQGIQMNSYCCQLRRHEKLMLVNLHIRGKDCSTDNHKPWSCGVIYLETNFSFPSLTVLSVWCLYVKEWGLSHLCCQATTSEAIEIQTCRMGSFYLNFIVL